MPALCNVSELAGSYKCFGSDRLPL